MQLAAAVSEKMPPSFERSLEEIRKKIKILSFSLHLGFKILSDEDDLVLSWRIQAIPDTLDNIAALPINPLLQLEVEVSYKCLAVKIVSIWI